MTTDLPVFSVHLSQPEWYKQYVRVQPGVIMKLLLWQTTLKQNQIRPPCPTSEQRETTSAGFDDGGEVMMPTSLLLNLCLLMTYLGTTPFLSVSLSIYAMVDVGNGTGTGCCRTKWIIGTGVVNSTKDRGNSIWNLFQFTAVHFFN